VLGVAAFAGRTFDAETDRNPTPVAVISQAYWKRRFALDPGVIGRSFRWNNRAFTIIGVTPPEFQGVVPGVLPEITVPLAIGAEVLGDPARLTAESSIGSRVWDGFARATRSKRHRPKSRQSTRA
jgi:hypothetical protein